MSEGTAERRRDADPSPEGAAVPPRDATILPGAAIVGLEAEDAPAALRGLSARLREIGAVTDSFEAAVLLREEKHPTGLPTIVPAAIPHTDRHHRRPAQPRADLVSPRAAHQRNASSLRQAHHFLHCAGARVGRHDHATQPVPL